MSSSDSPISESKIEGIVEAFTDYQKFASENIAFDNPVEKKIRGMRIPQYFLLGIQEELGEINELTDTGFDRLKVITNSTEEREVPEEESIRQQKEFGDTYWYLANTFKYFNVDISHSLKVGDRLLAENDISVVDRDDYDTNLNQEYSWIKFLIASKGLHRTVESFFRNTPMIELNKSRLPRLLSSEDVRSRNLLVHRDDRITPKQNLAKYGGAFLLSSSELLKLSFNTTFERVLDQNVEKLTKRLESGTILKNVDGSGGGDDR